MLFRAIGDTYEIVPPIIHGDVINRQLPPEDQLYLTVEGITLTEADMLEKEAALDERRFEPAKRIDEQQRRVKELVLKKIKGVHNCRLPGGKTVTAPAEFLDIIDRSVRDWLYVVLNSTAELTRSERANFTQPSNSHLL